jgi:hypothetical protein
LAEFLGRYDECDDWPPLQSSEYAQRTVYPLQPYHDQRHRENVRADNVNPCLAPFAPTGNRAARLLARPQDPVLTR